MAVPDFQTLMLPLLKFAADRQEHSTSDAIDALALEFRLTDEERKELLPSGRQSKFDNRVRWAATYLKKASSLSERKIW
jgi:restriction system protein